MILAKRLEEVKAKIAEIKDKNDRANWDDSYNCHGLTCYLFGIKDRLEWVEPHDMMQIVVANQKKIRKAEGIERKVGEILAIDLDEYDCSHSATYLGNGQYIQKRGRAELEITDFNTIRTLYTGQEVQRLLVSKGAK